MALARLASLLYTKAVLETASEKFYSVRAWSSYSPDQAHALFMRFGASYQGDPRMLVPHDDENALLNSTTAVLAATL